MRAFVVRPFGTKNDIDFDRVHRELVGPALQRLGIDGGTTAQFLEAGNIRVDMFQELITADVAVVDVSIHSANVYYELGIRHALRSRVTFLIRARADAYPFDLQTDRYLDYDPANPAAAVERLVDGLRQSLAGSRDDSPVHLLVPALGDVDPSHLLVVHPEFAEEVRRAQAAVSPGDLDLLAAEVRGLPWEREGLRAVGRAQMDIQAYEGATVTWEALRGLAGDDLEASIRLGTLYQRRGMLVESDLALKRVSESPGSEGRDRSEALALVARNAKDRWREEWESVPEGQRRATALASPRLLESADGYRQAFEEDLNHYYPGVNAVAMYAVLCELGEALPEVWSAVHAGAEPPLSLERARERRETLTQATRLSIDAARARAARGRPDPWVEASAADLRCLAGRDPAKVVAAYRNALKGAPAFAIDSTARQLEVYASLGVVTATAPGALEAVRALGAHPRDRARPGTPPRVIVFTGHRVDAPGRAKPRFPPDKEAVAREQIRRAVERERASGATTGLAGGASGGDILFHEVCLELGIPTRLHLAMPPAAYVAGSVAPSGGNWVERFWALTKVIELRQLSGSEALPSWLAAKRDYDVWQRNNLWTLHHALAAGPGNVTLLALWDGEAIGDGPGGTAHMVNEARSRGARVEVIDTKAAFWPP
jgi:hypothetical protein